MFSNTLQNKSYRKDILFIDTTFGARSLLTRTGEQIHKPRNESVKKAKIGSSLIYLNLHIYYKISTYYLQLL